MKEVEEEHSLKEVENWVLWKICGPKKDEARGRWRRLYKGELYDLELHTKYCLRDEIKKKEIGKAGET